MSVSWGGCKCIIYECISSDPTKVCWCIVIQKIVSERILIADLYVHIKFWRLYYGESKCAHMNTDIYERLVANVTNNVIRESEFELHWERDVQPYTPVTD